MDYLDLRLTIDVVPSGQLQVRIDSRLGTVVARRPYAAGELLAALAAARPGTTRDIGLGDEPEHAPTARDVIVATGARLFEAIFFGEVEQKYRSAWDYILLQQLGMRLRLECESTELAALPWEYLYDPRRSLFLCNNSLTTVVRSVPVTDPVARLEITGSLRVLGMIAAPRGTAPIDAARERAAISEALGDLVAQEDVQLAWVDGGTRGALLAALAAHRPHVFHFIGHGTAGAGTSDGALLFESVRDDIDAVSAAEFGALWIGFRDLRLIVLNACHGAGQVSRDAMQSVAGRAVHDGIPAIIAMRAAITDVGAIRFARALYTNLAASGAIDRAVAGARLELTEASGTEWGLPILYMQSSTGALVTAGTTHTRNVRRRLVRGGAGGVAGLAIALSVLATWEGAPHAVTARVRAEAVTFRLARPQQIADVLELDSLLAFRLSSVDITGSGAVSGTRPASTVFVSGARGAPAPLRVDLGALTLDAGAVVTVARDRDTYVFTLVGRVPPLPLTVNPPAMLAIDQGPAARLAEVARIELHGSAAGTEDRRVSFIASFARGASVALAPTLDVARLDLFRRELSSDGLPHSTSSISTGVIMVGDGPAIPLGQGSDLRLHNLRGTIDQLRLEPAGISLEVRGRVDSVGMGSNGRVATLSTAAWRRLGQPRAIGIGVLGALLGGWLAAGRRQRPRVRRRMT